MKIACLAWGSLIWKPENLPLSSEWYSDGPLMPVEFSRVGDGGELATAICMNAPLVPVYWATLNASTPNQAAAALREREQIPASRDDGVGALLLNVAPAGPLAEWASEKGIDALIWTALPPRFAETEGRIPGIEDALSWLASLTGETREHAFDYIARVPAQFDTPYRRAIRSRFTALR